MILTFNDNEEDMFRQIIKILIDNEMKKAKFCKQAGISEEDLQDGGLYGGRHARYFSVSVL